MSRRQDGITLSVEESAALDRYITAHGIPYNADDGLMQGIVSKLSLLGPRGDLMDPPNGGER